MVIGGLQKFSLLDYPGHLSAIIFTQGCNFRCQFCYNPMLVEPVRQASENTVSGFENAGKFKNISCPQKGEKQKDCLKPISEDGLFDFLKNRVKKLDAVVITGGEPTIHSDLKRFIGEIKKLGYKIKLDTNGTNPETLKDLIENNLIDYIAMDIKGPEEKYDIITQVQPDLNEIRKSIKIIKESDLSYEFRTTIVPELIEAGDIAKIGKLILGAKKWYLQQFKSEIDLVNNEFKGVAAYAIGELEKMQKTGNKYVKDCVVR